MKHCSHCNLNVSGDLTRCPLCSAQLEGAPSPPAFPPLSFHRTSSQARGLLAAITCACLVVIVFVCVELKASVLFIIGVCAGVVLNYIFVRNIIVFRPDSIRMVQRYFLVLVATTLIWFIVTGNTIVSSGVIPLICMTDSLVNAILIAVFKADYLQNYAKYILYAVVLGGLPPVLWALGFAPWPALSWASAAGSLLLCALTVAFGHGHIRDEIRRLFHA